MRPHTKLLVIELDPTLCGRLKARFQNVPNLDVVQGDATQFDKLLADRGIPAGRSRALRAAAAVVPGRSAARGDQDLRAHARDRTARSGN